MIVLVSFVLLCGILLALLRNKKIQNSLLQTATEYFSDKFGTKVQIASVDLELFNKVLLEEVYMEDLRGDTLLYVDNLKMGFSIWGLLQNRIICNYIELEELKANLVLDQDSVYNFSFLADAFKNDGATSTVIYQLGDIKLSKAQVSYKNERVEAVRRGFDFNALALTDVSAHIALHLISKDSLSLEIKQLAFADRSGFLLDNATAQLQANKKEATITNVTITLPKSFISTGPVRISAPDLTDTKHLAETAQFDFSVENSSVELTDLKAFVPTFKRTKGKLHLSTHFSGSFRNIKSKDLLLDYNNAISLHGDISLTGLPNMDETFIHTKIKSIKTNKSKMQDLLSVVLNRPVLLPDELNRLGDIRYKGTISGFFSDLVVYGNLKTDIGTISTDILMAISTDFTAMNYSGSFHAEELKLQKMFGEKSGIGSAGFNLSSTGSIQPKGNIKGIVAGDIPFITIKNYTYNNILLKGDFDSKNFDGWIGLNDEHAKLDFNGALDFSKQIPFGQFGVRIEKLHLNKLNLITSYPDLDFACNISAAFTGKNFDQTDIFVDSLFINNKNERFFSKKIYLTTSIVDATKVLKINSDLFEGTVKGDFSFLSIAKSVVNTLQPYLPALLDKPTVKQKLPNNDFVFYLTNFNVDALAKVFEIDVSLAKQSLLSGFYTNKKDQFRVEFIVPKLRYGKNNYKDFNFLCNNQGSVIQLSSTAELNQKIALNLVSSISNDSVQLMLHWNNPTVFSGKVESLCLFSKDEAMHPHAAIAILPSQLWIKDSLWNISTCTLETDFKKLRINDFALEHKEQYIRIKGLASNDASDSLFVSLNEVNLGSIMNLVKVRTPIIEGLVTGECLVQSVFDKMILQLDIFAKDFTFNKALWGDVKMKSVWSDKDKKLLANGFAYTGKDTAFHLAGEYHPRNDSMEFYADTKKLNLKFLQYYLDGALHNVSGDASGKLRIFGGLRRFQFEGDILVTDGRFSVDFLKTAYHFTDTVHVRKEAIRFTNITLYDFENNSGLFNGSLTHKNFKDMRYRFDIKCNNVLAMNTTQKDNEDFYGKAYGTGTVRIVGSSSRVDFTVNMKTEPKTKVVIPMVTAESATENSFIQFVNNKARTELAAQAKLPVPNKTHIHMHLQLEATPDAEIKLITDPVGGDMVRAEGNGNLRIDYDNIEDIKLYGDFVVERGDYVFTLQQVVRKNFMLKRGGSIRWSGNPYEAIIDLNATYTVPSVSLLDILEEVDLDGVSRTSIPVNCLLNLTGDLMKPTIKFDLELPSDPELQRRIKNIVNTEEMMNREILALLVMSRFYKPDYLQSERTGLGTEMVSVLTTTASGQLNSWLSKLNDKLNVGFDARLGNGQDISSGGEYKVGLMYQPNNRLIINSNLGYRDDVYTVNSTNFIGDVDVEYKLNKSGKLRAKAYTHSADNFFINASGTAKTTQGLGLMYREDYDSFSEVIRYYFFKKTSPSDTLSTKNP